MGGLGRNANTPVTSYFSGDGAKFTGVLILFMGVFLLAIAYHLRKTDGRERRKEPRPEPEKPGNETLSDTTGTPWEDDPDHTSRQ
ncbi:MAG: hypothetical protein RLZ97_2649 [Verrucomicrobiota bacterium]